MSVRLRKETIFRMDHLCGRASLSGTKPLSSFSAWIRRAVASVPTGLLETHSKWRPAVRLTLPRGAQDGFQDVCPNSTTSENHMVQRQVQFYKVTPIILLEMVLSITLIQDNRMAKVHP